MAYRADIEIGVKGASRLKELQDRITRLDRSIEDVNVKTLIDRKAVQSIDTYAQAVNKASNNLREVAIQLDAAGKASGDYAQAISQYVTALGQSNAAQKLQNDLIADEIELRRKQKLAASGIIERTQYAGPIGPGPASAIGTLAGQAAPVAERISRTLQNRKDELALQQALLRLEEKSAAELNKKVQNQQELVKGTAEVLALLEQQAKRQQFLAGKSGIAQGPIAPAGAMGFPVALPLLKAEKQSLDITAKKQQILDRTVQTRQELAGLAGQLQRLDANSAVAIADADRAQQKLNASKLKELEISKQGALLAGKFSPIQGGTNIPGSPAFLKAQQKARREQISNVALGAGFPLLFGGGPGAVLGGAAGGLVPGPGAFAAQIAFSAIGQQLDKFAAAVTETGAALKNPIDNFDKLKEKGLLASASQEKYIAKLIEAGKVTEAAAIIQSEIVKKIGAQGVRDLQNAGAASDRFNKSLAELGIQIQAAVAGPLADFLTWVNSFVAGVAASNRQQAALTDFLTALRKASPQGYKQYFTESIALKNRTGGTVNAAAVQQLQQKFIKQYNLTPGATTTNVDATAAKQAKARTDELNAQVALSSKQLSLAGLTLEKDGQAYVQAAKSVALQEYDNKLIEIKNSWIGQIFDKEKNIALIRAANLNYAAKLKQLEAEITQNVEAREAAQARANIDLTQLYQKRVQQETEAAQFSRGTVAGLQQQLKTHDEITGYMRQQLDIESSLAIKEAERNGTLASAERIYGQKVLILNEERRLDKELTQNKLNQLEVEKRIALIKAASEAAQPFEDFRRNLDLQNQYAKTYLRLVTEGMVPAEAERLATFERLAAEQLYAVENQIKLTEAAITEAEARGASADFVQNLRDNLEQLNKAKSTATEQALKGPGNIGTKGDQLREFISRSQGDLNDLEAKAVRVADGIGNAFASSISDGVTSLIEGTQTATQVFANFLKSIADILLQESVKIIATYIAIGIAKAFAFGSQGTGGKPGDAVGDFNAAATAYSGSAFADGGYPPVGQASLVGENGPELFVPGRQGLVVPNDIFAATRAALNQGGTSSSAPFEENAQALAVSTSYSRERVLERDRQTMLTGAGGSMVIQTEVINNVEYATVDQVAQAAAASARQARAQVIADMRNRPSTRASLGLR